MLSRTIAEWDPDYADISYGLWEDNETFMDSERRSYMIEWLKQNQEEFLGETGWFFPNPNECKEGGFATIYKISNATNNYTCVIKIVSLVQLLGLGKYKTDNDKKLLEHGKSYMESKLRRLKEITKEGSPNLCQIKNYAFVPFGNGNPDFLTYKGMYSRILADYFICTAMEPLQEIDYNRNFCDNEKNFDEQRLIDFAIEVCDSLIQLGEFYHRDLHPKNFMLSMDESRRLKLIDYDTILEKGRNAPHLDFTFEARCDDLTQEYLSYRSPDVDHSYNIYDDIYSVGCILYDIANYDYSTKGFRARRYSSTNELLKCGEISEDFFKIIKTACSKDNRFRYSDWGEFKKALLGIKYTWRKYQRIDTIPGSCEIWLCKRNSISAIMRIIDVNDDKLKKEYERHYNINRTVKLDNITFPKLKDKFERDGSLFFIEEQPPGITLTKYIKTLNNDEYDEKYYVFIRRIFKRYVKLLSYNVSNNLLRSKILATYKNLITSDNIRILDNGNLWINGLAIPENEYKYYLEKENKHNYLLEYIDDEENNEYSTVYLLGVLLYELITGDFDITNEKQISSFKISEGKRGPLLDLMNACFAVYEEGYTIGDIEKFIENN